MLRETVRELRKNSGTFFRVIAPLKRVRTFKGPVLGFDTEYDSKTRKLVCYQLALADGDEPWPGILSTGKLTVDTLARGIRKLIGSEPSEVYLVSFFSIAELQFLPVRSNSFGWKEYGGGSFDCSFRSEKHSLTFHVFDLARFFDRQPLARVAESFGLKKLEMDRTRVSKSSLRSAKFREYALHDAGITCAILQGLRKQFARWEVDPIVEKTAASSAASVFRRGWVTDSEGIFCDNRQARLASLLACWGGRAEALERGSFDRVYEYDLSSAYPNAALAFGELPCQGSWSELSSLKNLSRWKGGVLRVEFSFKERERYPCLPVVLPTCQLYPRSGIEWVTLAEVVQALEWGATCRLVEGWVYKKGSSALCDYLREMLEARGKATGAGRVAYKLLCNSLIGKLAQRVSSIPLDQLRSKAAKAGILEDHARALGAEELAILGIHPEVHIGSVFMPEWNGLITGHVRARISALARETEAIYIATDAVWTEKKLKRLPFDLEEKRHGPAIVARTRLGMISEEGGEIHVAHHSIWNRKAAITALGNLEKGFLRYPVKRPIKFRESLRKGLQFGDWVTEWRAADTYWDDKRRLLPDGTSVPWKDRGEYEAQIERSKKDRKASKRAREQDRT